MKGDRAAVIGDPPVEPRPALVVLLALGGLAVLRRGRNESEMGLRGCFWELV